ncbi:general substrate transporter [Aspergillus insuetus]
MAIAIVFTQNSDTGPAAYRIPFATQWAFAGVAVIAAFILPESPVWLVAQDRLDKARAAMHRLGTDRDPSFLHRIQMTLNSEEDGTGRGGQMATFAECFQGRTDLRRTLVIVWLNILQQFVGMSLLTNAAYFLLMAGMSPKHALMVKLIGVASNMIANMATWYTAPRFGRRTIILFSIALDFFAWLAMGIAGCFDTAAANWFVGVALLLFGFFNSFGVASAVPIVAAEISCVRLRSKSQGIGFGAQCIMSWVFSFFTPYLYNTDEANWGGKIGFFFAGLSIIGYVVTWCVVPETKGRTFMELDWLFETGVRASRFGGAVVPTEGLGGGGEAKRVGAGQAESKEDF